MVETLSVFLNREPLGFVTLEGKDDRYGLDYSPSWLEDQGYAISPHLKPGGLPIRESEALSFQSPS